MIPSMKFQQLSKTSRIMIILKPMMLNLRILHSFRYISSQSFNRLFLSLFVPIFTSLRYIAHHIRFILCFKSFRHLMRLGERM